MIKYEKGILEQQMNFTFICSSKFDGLTYMIVEGATRSKLKCLEITKKMIIFAGEIYLS